MYIKNFKFRLTLGDWFAYDTIRQLYDTESNELIIHYFNDCKFINQNIYFNDIILCALECEKCFHIKVTLTIKHLSFT